LFKCQLANNFSNQFVLTVDNEKKVLTKLVSFIHKNWNKIKDNNPTIGSSKIKIVDWLIIIDALGLHLEHSTINYLNLIS